MPNPFAPFKIATHDAFINRARELQTILERAAQGACSGVVGNPHVGKSSLLRRLLEPNVSEPFMTQAAHYLFIEVDFQSFVSTDTPDEFWAYVLEECIIQQSAVETFFQRLLDARHFDSQRLLAAFTRLGQAGYRVVLLLDEFDYLFNLPQFATLDFLGPLRVLAMKSDGLTLVTASRLTVAQLNRQAAIYKDAVRGSDLFNYLEEIPLGSLPEQDVQSWLSAHFESTDLISDIRALAGRHPLLLQLAAELFYDADWEHEITYRDLQANFLQKAETQFQDVWDYLEPRAQIALAICTLTHLGGQLPSGERFSLEETDQYLTWYGREVRDMWRQGTLEIDPYGRAQIGSMAFLAWIAENKIVGTRGEEPQDAFTQWLADKQYKLGGLVTQEEMTWLQKTWQSIPKGLMDLGKQLLLPGSDSSC